MNDGSAGWLLFFGVVIGLVLVRRPINVDVHQSQQASPVVHVPSGGGAASSARSIVPILAVVGMGAVAVVALTTQASTTTVATQAISKTAQDAIDQQAITMQRALDAQMKIIEDGARYHAQPPTSIEPPAVEAPNPMNVIAVLLTIISAPIWLVAGVLAIKRSRSAPHGTPSAREVFGKVKVESMRGR